MRYGKLIDDVIDVVVDCAHKPGPELGEWVECGDAGPGWTHSNGVFTGPSQRQGRRFAINARLQEIDALTDRPRTRRELQLNKASTEEWLQTLDEEADALREELKTLAPERSRNSAARSGGGGGPLEPA